MAVAVTNATPSAQSTHYGPAGHDQGAGKPLDFVVRVVVLTKLSHFIITCGPLIGFKIPRKGPIPGIAVDWQDGPPLPPNADEPPASVPRLHNFGTTTTRGYEDRCQG